MPKVYLSPPYHYFNACAVSGCDETTHNNEYLDVLERFLQSCGIAYKRGPRRTPKSSEDGNALMRQAVAESDAWGAEVHYVSHTNASTNTVGGGKVQGCRPIIYTGSQRGERLATFMVSRRREVYPYAITLNRRSDLYELRVPAAVSFYEEHVFHDNPADARWFHQHYEAVARSVAKGLCDYFAIPYIEPPVQSVAPPQTGGDADSAVLTLPVLRRGDEGATVRAMQLLLNGLGHSTGAADGSFGPKTAAAVKRCRRAFALEESELCDGPLWRVILGL